MYFLTTALLIVSLFVSNAHAHGHLAFPGVFTGLADQRANQNQVNNCGLVTNAAITDARKRFPPTLLQPGAPARFTYTVTNGDGAGPLVVDFDTNGNGGQFTLQAAITTQVPGNNANLNQNQAPGGRFPGDFPLAFTVPANLNCPNGVCIMRVRNPQNFISCMFVTTNPNNANQFPIMFPSEQQTFLGNMMRQNAAVQAAAPGVVGAQQTIAFGAQGFIAGAQQQAVFGAAQTGVIGAGAIGAGVGAAGLPGVVRK